MRFSVCFLFALLVGFQSVWAQAEYATVMVDGCSGVCVDPSGLILTVKHCDLPETVRVRFRDRVLSAVRVYESPDTEGPVVYDCRSDGLPYLPVAASAPMVGERLTSFGFPARNNQRELRRQTGAVIRWSTFRFLGGEFTGNVLSFPCAGGWSGGPLINTRGEVCGLLSSSDARTSVFVSSASLRTAMAAVRSKSSRNPQNLPDLLVFGSTDCAPCRQFKSDLANLEWFAKRLDSLYRVELIDIRKSPERAEQFGITSVPAFVSSTGKRVVGYSGPEGLLASLGHATPPEPKPPPEERPEPPPLPIKSIPPEPQTPPIPPTKPTPTPEPAPANPAQSPADTLDRVVQVTQKAVTIATWLGITGVSGGTAGAVLGGLALWRSLRSRKNSQPQIHTPSPPTIVHDAEPLPQAIVPETRFAAYEKDSHAEAFAWAAAEIARKYPGSVATLESLQGLMNQYLASRGIKRTTNP